MEIELEESVGLKLIKVNIILFLPSSFSNISFI